MPRQRLVIIVIIVLLVCLLGGVVLYNTVGRLVNPAPLLSAGGRSDLTLPPGFRANVFAADLNGPRFIAFGPDGRLYVADRGNGRIVSLSDADGDGAAEDLTVFAADLDSPHSIVYHEGAWYVGVPSGVVRLQDTDGDGAADVRETVVADLPPGGVHSTRTVAFLPDGRMVVSVGSSCNVCVEEDPRRAAIVVYDDANGGNEQIFASGLRNAVGLAVQPQSGELWATVNGRDLMGDDLPPETVYVLSEGEDYGWPTCHAGDIVDPDLGAPGACDGVPAPLLRLQAHMAPLGLLFYEGDNFPAAYRGDLFIAMHGSWNRSVPVGYKVVRVPLENGRPAGEPQDFATGWLNRADNSANGRPVGLAVGPDGALYVSDDKGGFVYRFVYVGE